MIAKEVLHTVLGLDAVDQKPTIIIYSEQKSNRLDYVVEFIFKHVLKINYTVSNDLKEFEVSPFHKINYSSRKVEKAFDIIPAQLLFEKGISKKKPIADVKNGNIYFYSSHPSAGFNYDIFSAVFYFISRYEEWQAYTKDAHGRFELSESILFNKNESGQRFHLKPVVEIWIMELKQELLKAFPTLNFPEIIFKTLATIDVDNLFAYKHKGFIRTIGAGIKDLFKFDIANVMRRNRVINGLEVDPFDIYESFSKFCGEKKIPVIFFFLFRSGTKFDRTVNPRSGIFKKVFEVLKNNRAFIGLHPSYNSSSDSGMLKSEVEYFSEKSDSPVKLSRQHYLKFDIKTTPNLLLKNGINTDFSMGFASGAGFRAGASRPFYYYDFNSENKTELLFVPFCAMDGAYFVYNKISPDETLIELQKIKEEIKKVNGIFTTVFHERTFAEHLYPGFGNMYRKLLSE